MDAPELHSRLFRARRPFGESRRFLVLGGRAIRIEGLDADLCDALEPRWGGYLRRRYPEAPWVTLRLFRAGPDRWLEAPRSMEAYRIEARNDPARRVVVSYHFAVGTESEAQTEWRVGITEQDEEPLPRVLENALRFVVARRAADDGGLALHAAGVLRDGRVYLFAGPSRAGKSTAVKLATRSAGSASAVSLGDDFGLVLPSERGWLAPALPFDNSERAAAEPPGGPFPLAGIWRLFQGDETRVERPRAELAVASLLACAAFPWAMPECSERLLEHAGRYVEQGNYRHLVFSENSDLWPHLIPRS